MKSLLIILLLLVMVSSVMAQDEAVTTKGIKVGINMSKWSGNDIPYPTKYEKSLTGFAFGGFFTIPVTSLISIQPEILYSMKGAKFADENFAVKHKNNYLEIPVLCKYNLPTSNTTKYNIFVGPSIAFLMGSQLELSDGTDSEAVDTKELFSKTDLGLIFGFGIAFGSSTINTITIEGRFNLGLSETFDISGENIDVKNETFSILLGYSL